MTPFGMKTIEDEKLIALTFKWLSEINLKKLNYSEMTKITITVFFK